MTNEKKYFFFDTETSGFISKSKPYNDPEQAWLVQIGAILCTEEEVLNSINVIIKANGRSMNPHAEEIHGISVEQADEEGIEELEAVNLFGPLLRQADLLVCHNFDFDWTYVYQAMQRNIEHASDEARSAFYLDTPSFCTMKDKKVKEFVQAKNVKNRLKWPRLQELYWKLFLKEFENAHDAMADITATKRCFFELKKRGIISL